MKDWCSRHQEVRDLIEITHKHKGLRWIYSTLAHVVQEYPPITSAAEVVSSSLEDDFSYL